MNKIKFYVAAVLVLGVFLFSTVYAQNNSNSFSPDMLAKYKKLLNNAKKGIKKIRALEEDARRRNDKVVVNCVHPKLITAQRLLNIAEKSYVKLSKIKKDTKNSLEMLNREAKKIKLSSDRIEELVKDAGSCLSISSGEVLSKTEIIEGKEEIQEEKTETPVETTPIEDNKGEDVPEPSQSQ